MYNNNNNNVLECPFSTEPKACTTIKQKCKHGYIEESVHREMFQRQEAPNILNQQYITHFANKQKQMAQTSKIHLHHTQTLVSPENTIHGGKKKKKFAMLM